MRCKKCKEADYKKTRRHNLIQFWECPNCSAEYRSYIRRELTKQEVQEIVLGFRAGFSSDEIADKVGVSPTLAAITYLRVCG